MNLHLNESLADILKQVRLGMPNQKIYLVGGAVRDLVLGKALKDLDFVVKNGSVGLAKAVRRRFDAVWYTLDDEHQTARVILRPGQAEELVLDFTSFIGQSLEEDLRQRDFSINAMAIDLDDLDAIIDPLGGQNDLVSRQLRLSSPGSLLRDPQRVLRAVRLIRTLDLSYSVDILERLRVAALSLGKISGERVRDELLKCLTIPNLADTYLLLKEFGILYELLNWVYQVRPPDEVWTNATTGDLSALFNYYAEIYRPVWSSLEGESASAVGVLKVLEEILRAIEAGRTAFAFVNFDQNAPSSAIYMNALNSMLDESLQGGRSRKQLLVLFALFFFHQPFYVTDSQENGFCARDEIEIDCYEFGERISNTLMLGQKEEKFFELVCAGYRKITCLTWEQEIGTLELYRFFREVGSSGIGSAILQIAYQYEILLKNRKIPPLASEIILTWFRDHDTIVDPPRLIDGEDLKNNLNLQPGPEIGYYLEAVREAQVMGLVADRGEALEYVSGLLGKRRDYDIAFG